MLSALSLRNRLTLFIAALGAILFALTTVANFSLRSVDAKVDTVNHQWLAGTKLLGQLQDELSKFRTAETYRALAPDGASAAQAEALAADRRAKVNALEASYARLVGPDQGSAGTQAFDTALSAYLAQHDAWVAKPTIDNEPARPGSDLERLYRVADAQAGLLVDGNADAGSADTRAAALLTTQSMVVISVVSGIGMLFVGLLLIAVGRQITKPLEDITAALTNLAAGNRNVTIPELDRSDEIGEMAKAFDVFRANAEALEQAHDETRAAQDQAQTLARHDALTGLPNRRVFAGELDNALSRARRGVSNPSVLLVDLDGFKPVNDLKGHAVGDAVLCEVARRLTDAVRQGDTVARLGGDEFAVIFESAADPARRVDATMKFAARLIGLIREPIEVDGDVVEVGASVGIANCPADGTDPDALFRAADLAMYRAKLDGRGTYRFFEQSMDHDVRARALLEADLRKAIAENVIQPYYQPLVDIDRNRICGFEVLARWEHPERGFVPPSLFIPIVEHLGLMGNLTTAMLRRACSDARDWNGSPYLSINISPAQLKERLLPTRIMAVLSETGFPPSRLEVEVTETALINDIATAKEILATLQRLGIKVALDDFGTGYSSLYHLRELKFDKIKIDRSFVQSMQANPESEMIVDAIIGLTKSMGIPVTAEGIENPEALRRLEERRCEYGQGYLFGKAVPAAEASELAEHSDLNTRLLKSA